MFIGDRTTTACNSMHGSRAMWIDETFIVHLLYESIDCKTMINAGQKKKKMLQQNMNELGQ